MDEIISGVRLIKMYAWEKPFGTLVELSRLQELKTVKYSSYVRGLLMTFFLFTTRLAMYCIIVAMVLFDQPVTAEKIFVFFRLYNILSGSLGYKFVKGFAELVECTVSVNRLQSFLMLNEFQERSLTGWGKVLSGNLTVDDLTKTKYLNYEDKIVKNTMYSDRYAVVMKNVVAKWHPQKSGKTLDKINLKLVKGKLYALIGTVGSGKSSFLSSILGELSLVEGNVILDGSLSYFDQNAWVFGSSVRQNILFGQDFDSKRYQRVVEACSLCQDFSQFAQGDQTLVGERGSSLSGGQRARISLARALYRQADIYLLDDPLSAVS